MARLEGLERVADLHGRTDLPVLFTILIAGKEGAPLWGRAAQVKRSRAMERSVNRTDIPALDAPPAEGPHPTLGARHVAAIVVGIVIGAGIFRTPSLVAGVAGSEEAFLVAWLAGGILSIIGALCYAELAAAFPSAGGDYHFLSRAFGRRDRKSVVSGKSVSARVNLGG